MTKKKQIIKQFVLYDYNINYYWLSWLRKLENVKNTELQQVYISYCSNLFIIIAHTILEGYGKSIAVKL